MGITITADILLEKRLHGKTPAGIVIASLVPELGRFADQVQINKNSDFRGFHMLEVCVASVSTQMQESFEVIDSLLNIKPLLVLHWAIDTGRMASVYEFGQKHIMSTAPAFYGMTELARRLKCN